MYFDGSIGRITDYLKTAQLEQNWQKKKIELSGAKSEESKRADDWIINKKIGDIKNKMKSGRRLSHDEKEFLRMHAPDLYEKAMKIERERDEFRRALARCKTKEEAQRVQASKALELQAEAQAAAANLKNGNGKDESEFIAMRMMAIVDEYLDFSKSKEYSELEDEYKENKEEIDDEAENAENDGKTEPHEKNKKFKFKKIKTSSHEEILHSSYKYNEVKILNSPHSKFIGSTSASQAIKAPVASPTNKP